MKMRNLMLGLVAILVALPAMAAAPATATGINGKWESTIDSPMGAVNLVLEFKAEGEKLTGSIASEMGGQAMPASAISDGVMKGEDISFKLSVAMMPDAPPLLISYKGKLKGDELMLVSVFDMGDGVPQETPLVAKRAKK